ncbi:hypothetical protein ACVGVM_17170 [Pseudonocardia bannensis]|uniref:Peptide zinc metalloprotease protein n=1 Tax=Pseudonocardia bannensis TaxID=630973 RepID=A0A848DS60_9PSEU|nr:hypothetical protein [Pseudonocardia bannensis]NMH95319.1 hypothetical protein [Pseudonocardia bannensis]
MSVIATEGGLPEPRTERPSTPRLAEGTELIGEYQGSGFQEQQYLVARADGQVIQLPRLLFLLLADIDGRRDVEQLASRVGAGFGRDITGEQIAFLVEQKLRPAGLIAADHDGVVVAAVRPDPLLALRYRAKVVSPRVSWAVAGFFRPLFWPPVVVGALVALAALDVVIALQGGFGRLLPSAQALIHRPALTLLVLGTAFVFAVFHECGHVTACRYGGARPGAMGVGIYLVWPAMYSTVTDAYRLDRVGRLRTDLGGIYFNVVFLAGLAVAYLATAEPWLLATIVLLHVQTMWQFLPSLRLDGYYILSDLAGVPDLFSLLGPVVSSMLPGRPAHPRVAALKPWTRRLITVWVLLVIPFLLYFVVLIAVVVPLVLPMVWRSLVTLAGGIADAVRAGQVAAGALGVLQVVLLVLPWAGLAMVAVGTARAVATAVLRRLGRDTTSPAQIAARTAVAGWFTLAVLAAGLLAGVVLAGLGSRILTEGEAGLAAASSAVGGGVALPAWPDAVAVHQLAALEALLSGLTSAVAVDGARLVALVVGLAGCLALWPVVRRLGLHAPAAALAVALCAVVSLRGSVDPGALAAVWLTVAVALVGRGGTDRVLGVAAAAIGVLTAPLAAMGLLTYGACALVSGSRVRVPARLLAGAWLGAAVAVTVVATGDRPLSVTGSGPVAESLLPVVLVGAALLGVIWQRWPRLRPAAAAAGGFLVCVAMPGQHGSTALLLVAPLLATLVAALLDGVTAARPGLQRRLVVAAVAGIVVVSVAPRAGAAQRGPADGPGSTAGATRSEGAASPPSTDGVGAVDGRTGPAACRPQDAAHAAASPAAGSARATAPESGPAPAATSPDRGRTGAGPRPAAPTGARDGGSAARSGPAPVQRAPRQQIGAGSPVPLVLFAPPVPDVARAVAEVNRAVRAARDIGPAPGMSPGN